MRSFLRVLLAIIIFGHLAVFTGLTKTGEVAQSREVGTLDGRNMESSIFTRISAAFAAST